MRPDGGAPVALVTGATGGLGRPIALRLAQAGYHLLLHGRDVGRLAALSAEMTTAGGAPPHIIRADFRDLEDVAALCKAVEENTARLDLVINNAGAGFALEPDEPSRSQCTAPAFQVNYLAPYLIMHRLLRLMRGVEGSAILNIASLGQADLPKDLRQMGSGPDPIVYGRSKLALIMATRSLAGQVGEGAPAVYALHPGSMLDTNLTRSLLKRMPRWVGFCWRASRRLRPTVDSAAGFIVAVAVERPRMRPSGTFWTVNGPGRAKPQAADAVARDELEAFSRDAIAPFLGPASEDADSSRAQAT